MLTVKQRGQFVATMRWVHVTLMETLAAWVPTTPEMEVKLLLGEHIWDIAQHADSLGKRTFELRMPLQHSLRPVDAYARLLAEIAGMAPTTQRLAAVYEVLLPGLEARYHRYLDTTDTLSDAPTVRILERHLVDMQRMVGAARDLCREFPALRLNDQDWVEAMREREAGIDPVVAPSGAAAAVET